MNLEFENSFTVFFLKVLYLLRHFRDTLWSNGTLTISVNPSSCLVLV